MIYQARISLQTAALLEYLRQYFEQESGGFVSKGDVLNRAYLISGWTKKHDFDEVWNAIHNTPIPDIKTQQSIVDIFSVYQMRYDINEKLKEQIKNICPILIRGSLEEGRVL